MSTLSNPERFARMLPALTPRSYSVAKAERIDVRRQLVAEAVPAVRKVKVAQRVRPDPQRRHNKPVSQPRAELGTGTEPTCPTCFGMRRIFGWPYGSANDCGGCQGAGVMPVRTAPET